MGSINEKLKQFLLNETNGKTFPVGEVPHFKNFCIEVTEGLKWYRRQRLMLKVIINTIHLFPMVPLTEDEHTDLKLLMQNAENPAGDARYAQAVVRRDHRVKTPIVILIIAGRGAGKSTMSGVIIGYVIRWLVSLGDPHKFFGLGRFKPISIQALAGKEDQAKALFQIVKSVVRRCRDLKGTYDELQNSLNFGGVVQAMAFSSNADTVRGYDTFLYYHEECAFCAEDTPENIKSFTQTYKAIRPAVLNRFLSNGIFLFVTSAGIKGGQTYTLYKQIKNGTIKNCVMFQLAAWEIGNPRFTKKADFEEDYLIDPITAEAEQGAQFVDTMNAFFIEEEINRAVKPYLKKREAGEKHIQYAIRLDPSARHDRYALSLGHKEYYTEKVGGKEYTRIKVVIDHVHYWQAKWIDSEGNEIHGLSQAKRAKLIAQGGKCIPVNENEVLDYIEDLIDKFNVMRVVSDQHNSNWIIGELQDRHGTEKYEFGIVKPITELHNWMAYRNAKKMIAMDAFDIYPEQAWIEEARVAMRYNKNKPLDHSEVYSEIDEEAESPDMPRLIYKVEAPRSGPVKTDDCLDAVVFNADDMMRDTSMAPAVFKGEIAKGIRDSAKQYKDNDVNNPILEGLEDIW